MSKGEPGRATVLETLGGGQLSLQTLVQLLTDDGFSRDRAIVAVMNSEQAKEITLDEPRPYATLSQFALSPMSVWFWSSVVAIAFSLLLLSASSGAALYLRYAFGGVLVLFLPGYALIEALYPKRDLDELSRFALSVGLSLAVVPLAGLVLNFTPFGIRLLPVALSIAGITVFFMMVALLRKHAYYKLAKGIF